MLFLYIFLIIWIVICLYCLIKILTTIISLFLITKRLKIINNKLDNLIYSARKELNQKMEVKNGRKSRRAKDWNW